MGDCVYETVLNGLSVLVQQPDMAVRQVMRDG